MCLYLGRRVYKIANIIREEFTHIYSTGCPPLPLTGRKVKSIRSTVRKWNYERLKLKINYAYQPNSIRCGGAGNTTTIPSNVLYRAYKIFWEESWSNGMKFDAPTIAQLLFHVIREDGM